MKCGGSKLKSNKKSYIKKYYINTKIYIFISKKEYYIYVKRK